MTGITDMMKKAVIVYGAGISGRGAAGVLAQAGQQVFLYNDNPCTIEQELQVALQAAGGALIIGEANSFLIACIIAGGVAEFIGVQLAISYYARRK